MNIILDVDSYKAGMIKQYPPGTEYISSYIEARGGKDSAKNKTVFFGMQYYIKKYLSHPISQENIDEAAEVLELHGQYFDKAAWEYILEKHGGYLPLKVESVLEGVVMPIGNVLVQVTNTDPKCFWLTTWVETSMLRTIMYATSVASNGRRIKELMNDFYIKSGSVDGLDFKLHDFGSRGVSSKESAGIGGLAHLINFKGTDTLEAIMYGRKYYSEKCAGFSLPASEHSTMTTWGNEHKAIENMLDAYPGYNMVACVMDSYDIYQAVDFLGTLREKIKKSGKTFVVRPDSGDPTIVPIQIIKQLMDIFGYETNSKGYKTLPYYVRVLQGDGINEKSIKLILAELDESKLSLDNLAFGMGSGLLQEVLRDDYGFAMKASSRTTNGIQYDVFKDPLHGGKTSKKGVLGLYHNENTGFTTERLIDDNASLLNTVYYNGGIIGQTNFADIRQRGKLTNANTP